MDIVPSDKRSPRIRVLNSAVSEVLTLQCRDDWPGRQTSSGGQTVTEVGTADELTTIHQ